MRKTYVLWFAFLAILLVGCRSEDFTNQSANSQREEEFFRDAEKLTSRLKQSTEIIDRLRDENERSHFISKMADQKGLPIWNKIDLKKSNKVAGKGEKGLLEIVIPLTEDQKTLSSLLFVTETGDGQLQISNTNNEVLKSIVFDSSISSDIRENYLMNFILADRAVFGTSKYLNIPADLLADIPADDGANLKSFEVTSTTIDNTPTENATSGMVCFDIEVPKPNCDCHGTITRTVCFLVFNPDTGGDGGGSGGGTSGGGGGTGGGGGGTPNPGEHDPDDDGGGNNPCFNRPFYRQQAPNTPPCDVVVYVSPCEKIKDQKKDDNFVAAMQGLKNNVGLKKETGFFQKNSGAFVYQDNANATEQNNSLALPEAASNTYIKGYLHTHVNDYKYYDSAEQMDKIRMGIKIFSPADISYIMDMLKNAQAANRPLNEVYAVMVSNTANYQIRFTGNQYQIKTFTDSQKEEFRKAYLELMRNKIDKQKKLELGFLNFIYDKMNLRGVALYRMNQDGTTTEIKLNADKTDTVESNCPN